ncbi:hypothetical protein ACOSQ4_029573 [Xanthoceras sorbifolium]
MKMVVSFSICLDDVVAAQLKLSLESSLELQPPGSCSCSHLHLLLLLLIRTLMATRFHFPRILKMLVPWGNAYINNSSIVCKHGPDQCLLNTIEACAINGYNDVNKYFGLISCIELLAIEGRQMAWQTCFSYLGLPLKPVMDCYNSRNGTKLELQYGRETAHLVPPHTLLPWVVVNNQPIRDDYENYTTYVCKAYKGQKAPNACKSSLPFA